MTYYYDLKYDPRTAKTVCRVGRYEANAGCVDCVTKSSCSLWDKHQEANKQINLKVFINDIGMIEIKRTED